LELVYEIAGDQIDGARDYQEDAFAVTFLDDEEARDGKSSVLVIMADGMGGHAAGNIASNLVVSTFNRTFTGNFGNDTIPELLRVALARSNNALAASIKETPALDGMGCTMVTAVLNKGKVFWISVGDSHLYVIRDRDLQKKNEDHSYGGYIERMKAQGVEVEAEPGLSRNMLMSAMTGEEIAEVDCPSEGLQLLPGDRVIVSSDGLDTLTAGTILQTSAWSPTAKECVSSLLRAVEDAKRPRQDNTTVIVIDVSERGGVGGGLPSPEDHADLEGIGGDTQEMSADELKEALAPLLRAERRRGGGPVRKVAAVVLLAVLIGALWYLLRGEPEPAPVPPITRVPDRTPPKAPTAPKPPPAPATRPEQPPAAPPTTATKPETVPGKVEPARTFRDPMASGGTAPEMVEIPGGSFIMGARAFAGENDELPRHRRTIAPFAMSRNEVTIAEYRAFARATGRKMPNLRNFDAATTPMILVSWDDATAYARWLSKETGKKYRLPTEAQWEYAARAGTVTPFWWGFEVGENNAHCFDCKTGLNPRLPTKVGRFKPNAFGLHDTSGNVMEWTQDCYHISYNGAPDDDSAWVGGDCSVRVVRGGSYGSVSNSLRNAARATRPSSDGTDETGIRLVREL
jgi:formylglycine-generating enzyme required for sulfatase activity/serine/threonine protein phosphatase PrpC